MRLTYGFDARFTIQYVYVVLSERLSMVDCE